MPRIRRKLPRIFASLLVTSSIACLPAPLVRVARAAGQESPAPAQKSALDAPARELARRIAASLPGGTRVEIEVRNQSSLSEDDAAAIRAAMAEELSARGLRTRGEGPGAASVVVTLSENVQGYVWIAQIQHGGDSAVLLQSVPRGASGPSVVESEKVVLQEELLWKGPERVLGASEAFATGLTPMRLLLLELEGTSAIVTDSENSFRTELPFEVPHPRDVEGQFEESRGEIAISLKRSEREDEDCTVSLDDKLTSKCARQAVAYFTLDDTGLPPSFPSGSQSAPISTLCKNHEVMLVSGKGDYTQPDVLVAYAINEKGGAVSAPTQLPGPVIRLWPDRNSDTGALAIVRDLQNGNYEVYRITAACGQ